MVMHLPCDYDIYLDMDIISTHYTTLYCPQRGQDRIDADRITSHHDQGPVSI